MTPACGDFNTEPDSASLNPLHHPSYAPGTGSGRFGEADACADRRSTTSTCNEESFSAALDDQKLDFIFLSSRNWSFNDGDATSSLRSDHDILRGSSVLLGGQLLQSPAPAAEKRRRPGLVGIEVLGRCPGPTLMATSSASRPTDGDQDRSASTRAAHADRLATPVPVDCRGSSPRPARMSPRHAPQQFRAPCGWTGGYSSVRVAYLGRGQARASAATGGST